MNGRLILIAGSADKECPSENLRTAISFAREAAAAIIETGSSVAVLATREPTREENGVEIPLTFDWEILREVKRVTNNRALEGGRILARVFTGADSLEKRLSEGNTRLLQELQGLGVAEVTFIEEEMYSGGEYRDWQQACCDGMIAVGGGAGTYQVARKMCDAGKPVFPVDIQIGARHRDGTGAIQLLSEMKTVGERFLPRNHRIVNEKLALLSLEHPHWSMGRVATTIAKVMDDEVSREDIPEPVGLFGKLKAKLQGKLLPSAQGAFYTVKTSEAIADLFQ